MNPYIGGLHFYTIFLFKVHIKFKVYVKFNLNFCEWKESIAHLPEVLKATGNAPKEWRHSKLHQLGSSNTFSIHPLILGISLSYWNLNYHICTENKPRANCCCCAKTLEICWLSRAEQPRGVWNQIAEQSWVRELLSWAADLQPVQQRIGTIFFI